MKEQLPVLNDDPWSRMSRFQSIALLSSISPSMRPIRMSRFELMEIDRKWPFGWHRSSTFAGMEARRRGHGLIRDARVHGRAFYGEWLGAGS